MRKGTADRDDVITLLRLGFHWAVVQNHEDSLTVQGSVMSVHSMKMDAEHEAERLTGMYRALTGEDGDLYEVIAVSNLIEGVGSGDWSADY